MPAMYLLRFDMRAPDDGPAAIADLYDAAIEMAVWGEQHGALSIAVSEHHASPDGYLPSPLILATALAARRAARFGLGFFAQTWAHGLEQTYYDECARLGNEPGACFVPGRNTATSIFVAEDVDRAWEQIGPYMLHDARMYASWLGDAAAASKSTALTFDALRTEGGAYRILTPAEAVDHVR